MPFARSNAIALMIGASPLDRREHSADPPNGSDFLRMRYAPCIVRNPRIKKEGAKIMSAAVSAIAAQSMKIAKVKEHIGAIVTGIDLAQPIDAGTRKELYDAAVDNVVLVIRGQAHITPAQLQTAGEMFGELMEDQNRRYLVDGFPLISVLDNRHKDSKGQPAKVGANAPWHTDHTNQELPP